MLRVVVLRVLFFVDAELPVFSVALILYCLKLFYVKLMPDQLIRYLRVMIMTLSFDGLHARCDM